MSNNSYYIFSSGTIKRKDNSLIVITENEIKKDIPIEQVYELYLFGELTLNTKLLNFLSQKKICVHVFNYYGYYNGTYYPRETLVSGSLLIKQVEKYQNFEERLFIAQKFIDGASYNILRNLKYYQNRNKDLKQTIDEINKLRGAIFTTYSIEELMGIEGNIRKVYYDSWNIIINQDIHFEKRVRRPPDNMINTLISFLNSLLYTRTVAEIYKTQLNPTISYLHVPGTKRLSLSLDLSEIFKPLIVDRTIFSLLNKNIITENDFVDQNNFLILKDAACRKIVKYFDETLQRSIKHKSLNRSVTYQHLIRLEAYKLIKHILDEKIYEPFKMWW